MAITFVESIHIKLSNEGGDVGVFKVLTDKSELVLAKKDKK